MLVLTPEFRKGAVELARAGTKPVSQIARDLGISESCLRNWATKADGDKAASKFSRAGIKRTSSKYAEARTLKLDDENLKSPRRLFRARNVPQNDLPFHLPKL